MQDDKSTSSGHHFEIVFTFYRPKTISTHHVMFNLKKLGKKLIPPTNTEVVHQENCDHRLHSKVWNTKHTGSNSISKVRNFNSKQTEVFEGSELYFKADHCKSGTPLEADWYFEGPDVPFRKLDSIQRSRVTIFKGHLKTKPRLFEGLGRSISKAGLYLKSRAWADQNILKACASCMP
ncbi:hypothetical protein RclHR1_31380001 [Rhizophagus clarus]|uniref:Uncharacterized protein n=1 Tax=Rhizophagus clarus TaxID=94130 RepID=A0A2Z6S263_9GLOM|nr:hypothetical protein RclHR1_31380001 [Rhizophagus clarus]